MPANTRMPGEGWELPACMGSAQPRPAIGWWGGSRPIRAQGARSTATALSHAPATRPLLGRLQCSHALSEESRRDSTGQRGEVCVMSLQLAGVAEQGSKNGCKSMAPTVMPPLIWGCARVYIGVPAGCISHAIYDCTTGELVAAPP